MQASTIRWLVGFFATLLSALGVAFLVTNAQAADRIVLVPTRTQDISGANKALLATAVTSIWPVIPPAAVDQFVCKRGQNAVLTCIARGDNSGDEGAYFAANEAREVKLKSWDGVTATWLDTFKRVGLTAQHTTDLGNFITAAWPGSNLLTVTSLFCKRDPNDASVIDCTLRDLQTLSPVNALTILNTVRGARDVGVAE